MIASIKKQKQDDMKSDKRKQQATTVEVEFCSNCDAHLFTVRHQQHKYFSHFDAIRKKLMEQKIVVRKRPVPDNLYKKSPYCPSNVYYRVQTNQVVYFPEIGSFQVYFQGKKIFSKLETLKWPSPEGIAIEIQKILQDSKVKNSANHQPQGLNKSEDEPSSTKKEVVQSQGKRQQFRIKSKHPDDHLSFRYSIDRRNLFRKPQNNYLNRKSMTARNQSVSQSTNRTNRTALIPKRIVNEEEISPINEQMNKKQLTDEAVLRMYRKNPATNVGGDAEKTEVHSNLPQIPKKTRKNQVQGNIYLQPIFPKSNINLQNYTRQKQIMANKIHEQRKSYQASKQFKKQVEDKGSHQQRKGSLVLKAKFNENCNELLRNKEDKKELTKIKEATEENEMRNRDNQVVQVENKPAAEPVKIEQSKTSKEEVTNILERQGAQAHIQVGEKTEKTLGEHVLHKESSNEDVIPNIENKEQSPINEKPSQQKQQQHVIVALQQGKVPNQQQLPPTEKQQPQDKRQQQKQQEAHQQAYEAEFEEEQNKQEDKVAIVQGQRQQQPQKEVVSHDFPAQVKKSNEEEYEDEQFDKEQQQAKQVEKNLVNTEDMAELINETDALQPDSA